MWDEIAIIPEHCLSVYFGFFVEIHLLESSKLELYDWYLRNYSLMIYFLRNTIQRVDGF